MAASEPSGRTSEAFGAGAERATDPRFEAELRRGVLQLVALFLLDRPRYGYDLVRSLTEAGFAVEEGTLYPILRRFEQQRWVTSSWSTAGARPRKYYRLSDDGRDVRDRMAHTWDRVRHATEAVLGADAASQAPEDDEEPGDA
ncbi:MAG: PadR family transcriptional regulator [Planctomycetota bacterium]